MSTAATGASPAPSVEPDASTATVAPFFQPFGDFTFLPVEPAVLEQFEAAVAASLGDAGSIGEVHAADAVRGDEPAVTVFAFTLAPNGDATDQTLFGLVLDAIAGSLASDWEPAIEGQAFAIHAPDQSVFVMPWQRSQDGSILFLFATGAPDAPVEEVMRALAE
jgi:hypothetical protein